MNNLKRVLDFFASLKLACVCLFGFFIIVFWGTLFQVNYGIYYSQKLIFQSLFIYLPVGPYQIPVFPGGLFWGCLLIISLTLSTLFKLRWSFRNVGLLLTHIGLIILLLGSGATSFFAKESQLVFEEGQTLSYSQDLKEAELIFVDSSSVSLDRVISFPFSTLLVSGTYQLPSSDLRFVVDEKYDNVLVDLLESGQINSKFSLGLGPYLSVKSLKPFVRDDYQNNPGLSVSLYSGKQLLGRLFLSSDMLQLQPVSEHFSVALRYRRYYYPFSLQLLNFTHDVYPGTQIPKNFSSKVRLHDFQTSEDRELLIYMNHPLRYKGLTFYQSSFGKNNTLSVLQVVQNPAVNIPYFSCLVISLGLLIHFFMMLIRFVSRRAS